MAAQPFAADEKAKIRMYLGWSDRFRDYDTRLETMMDSLGLDPDADIGAAANIRDLLSKLANVDTSLESGLGNQTLKAVEGGTSFQGADEMRAYRVHGRSLVQRMAIIFDVEPKRDYYAEGGGDGAGGMLSFG